MINKEGSKPRYMDLRELEVVYEVTYANRQSEFFKEYGKAKGSMDSHSKIIKYQEVV